ncbi:MAG: glycerate kinase family protein [Solirubrobacteraceae bacterium]
MSRIVGVPETVLIAPDSFKDTFSATVVAAAIGRGVEGAGWPVDLCPVADGGEGTLDALAAGLGAERRTAAATDPLGRPIEAEFGLAGEVALIDTAAASGLNLIAEAERDAVAAGTAGTGELIAAAVDAGARIVYLGVGGSATTDGGAGAIKAIERAGGLRGARLAVLCDVRTPFEDAAKVYGPQKGASPDDVKRLTKRLNALAGRLDRDPRGMPMTGAAGGLSGGLWSAFGAELVPGAAFVLDEVGFDARMRAARAVVTGEGKLDMQSLVGKVVSEVATRARQTGVPCHAVVGTRELDSMGARILDLDRVIEASTLAELEAAGRTLAEVL